MTTSVKGIPRVFKSRNKPMGCLWLTATLVLLVFALYQSFTLIAAFLRYETVTDVHEYGVQEVLYKLNSDTDQKISSSLDAMTFCNNNPVPSKQNLNNVWTYAQYKEFIQLSFGTENFTQKQKQAYNLYDSPAGYYRNVPIQNLTHIGYTVDDVLLTCQYTLMGGYGLNSKPCKDIADIKIFSSPAFLNCFTIEINASKISKNSSPLDMSGIMYLDNVDDELHLSYSAPQNDFSSSGALVIFHLPGEYPNTWNAQAMPSGFESKIHTEQTAGLRLGVPYGKCERKPHTYYDFQGRPYIYSTHACLNNCLMEHIIINCGCIVPEFAVMSSPHQSGKYPMCGMLSNDSSSAEYQMDCVFNISNSGNRTCISVCLTKCKEQSTSTSTTYLEWPKDIFQLSLYKNFIEDRPFADHFTEYQAIYEQINAKHLNYSGHLDKLNNLHAIRKNFLKFTILTNQEKFTVIEDKPKLTITELFSQIGGILNLYSGITMLILVELLELLFNLCSTTVNAGEVSVTPVQSIKA